MKPACCDVISVAVIVTEGTKVIRCYRIAYMRKQITYYVCMTNTTVILSDIVHVGVRMIDKLFTFKLS